MEKENIAVPTGNVFKNNTIEEYEVLRDQCYFEMKDKYHTFQIGLRDLLMCLKFAEDIGELPPHDAWWLKIADRYDLDLSE